jgi:hypothetical protein
VGTLMIRCPNTGRTISTGMAADEPKFRSTPVFFSRTFCPICRTVHQWFAKEAWVCNASQVVMALPRARRRQAALL